MIEYTFLDKAQKNIWLPMLFDLYHSNMDEIAPSGLPYQEEKAQWLSAVSPALDKEPRRILLCTNQNVLLGYIQYYTRDDLLMIEEVQIQKEYHRTPLFYRMCKYLAKKLPPEIRYIEAYADKRNKNSLNLMRKLGMMPTTASNDSMFIHLRGDAELAGKHFV